jgi:superfamily II DNA or RNA helicase
VRQSVQRIPTAPPAELSELAHCHAVFLPADPARRGRLAFWRADGGAFRQKNGLALGRTDGEASPGVADSSVTDLEVVVPAADGGVTRSRTSALVVPVHSALPLLMRARGLRQGGRSAVFWDTARLLALHFLARGLLLPGLSPGEHDTWRVGPLSGRDTELVRALAAAMPPEAHSVPLTVDGRPLLPDPERLLRAFLDAVADTLPRSPAAAMVTGGPAYAAAEPQRLPDLRAWADDVAAGHDAGVRLSLRVEAQGLDDAAQQDDAPVRFRAVLQVHGPGGVTDVMDAAGLWTAGAGRDASGGADAFGAEDASGAADAFGPRARADALLALRRAARAWPPLAPLLSAAVPDTVDLADDEIADLLGEGARALASAGVDVHWPKRLSRELTVHAKVGPPDGGTTGPGGASAPSSFLTAGPGVALGWSFALGGRELSGEELDRLAEAKRPLVRLRDGWVLVDPREAQRARARPDRSLAPVEALAAALTGSAEIDGREVDVRTTGWLDGLRERLADAGAARTIEEPPGLAAVLRDYQLRGLDWLVRTTSLGLGCCLADDMGLGKTITLIALHLHRQTDASTAGPTLVVCPASLLGNWQREIERFAPGVTLRRFHGAGRDLGSVGAGEFVLTTYGTMRLDAERLTEVPWGMVVADEAQHVKNPYSATAGALRSIGARARVALTGTPVENSLTDLWAILDWTTPGLLGRRLGTFRARYAQQVEGGRDPATAERLARLVRPFLLRRRKSDPGIAPELPPKTETDHPVALTGEQAGLYEALVRETLDLIAATDDMARRGLIMRLLTGLKQICNHPAQFLKEDDARLSGRSGKLELLDELLGTILAEGSGVLVFTQYVRMARLLERHLANRGVPSLLLHGGTPVPAREEMVRRFQEGEVPVFLLSLKAAGTGLNLTRAEHVVHYDRWWNPAVEAQATDRAYRIGQARPVQVHRLIAEGTLEDRIAQMLARKRELADAVLGIGEAALTELTDAELAALVELREEA